MGPVRPLSLGSVSCPARPIPRSHGPSGAAAGPLDPTGARLQPPVCAVPQRPRPRDFPPGGGGTRERIPDARRPRGSKPPSWAYLRRPNGRGKDPGACHPDLDRVHRRRHPGPSAPGVLSLRTGGSRHVVVQLSTVRAAVRHCFANLFFTMPSLAQLLCDCPAPCCRLLQIGAPLGYTADREMHL